MRATHPHNTFWRRMNRRYGSFYIRFMAVIMLLSALWPACVLLWMLPGWRETLLFKVVYWSCCLFFVCICLLGSLAILFMIYYSRLRASVGLPPPKNWKPGNSYFLLITLFLETFLLIVGRIDEAVYVSFVSSLISTILHTVQQRTWRHLPNAAAALSKLVGFCIRSLWLTAGGWIFEYILRFVRLGRPPFVETVRKKQTKAEYLSEQEAIHRAYGNGYHEGLIRTLCALKMWDKAEVELRKMEGDWQSSKRLNWRTRILLGSGQYEKVIRLAEPEVNKQFKEVFAPLALAYAKQGQIEDALRVAQQSVSEKLSDAPRTLGDLYFDMDDYETALLWYEREAAGGLTSQTQHAIGKTLMALGDYQEARDILKRAVLAANYIDVEVLQSLEACCRQMNDLEGAAEAVALAQEAESRS